MVQLIRALESEGGEGEPEDGEHLARLAATGASRAILGRLARLGADETEVARAIAILEPNAEGRVIAQLTGLPIDRVATAGAQLAPRPCSSTGDRSPSSIPSSARRC